MSHARRRNSYFGFAACPVLAALFWHARVYPLYRLLGERVGDLSYYWFCFQFQTRELRNSFLDTWIFLALCQTI
jgi:hypothetical protein